MLIRAAQPDDALSVAHVHVRSWQSAYRGLLPDDYLDRLNANERAQRYDFANTDPQKPKTFVAMDEESVIGFATISPALEFNTAKCGKLAALYVDPDHCGQGIGSQLLRHAESVLAARGYQHAMLWVLQGNSKAEHFYSVRGWKADGQQRRDLVWGIAVEEVGYRRELASL